MAPYHEEIVLGRKMSTDEDKLLADICMRLDALEQRVVVPVVAAELPTAINLKIPYESSAISAYTTAIAANANDWRGAVFAAGLAAIKAKKLLALEKAKKLAKVIDPQLWELVHPDYEPWEPLPKEEGTGSVLNKRLHESLVNAKEIIEDIFDDAAFED